MKIYRGAVLAVVSISLIGCGQSSGEAELSSDLDSPDPTIESAGEQEITPPEENLSLVEEFDLSQDYVDVLKDELTDTTGIQPDNISIPSLEIDTNVVEVGLLEDGSMGVPDTGEEVGWYEPGTMPGATGNSVLAGHVDDRTGPAIFFTLDQIEEGASVYVTDNAGEELEFEVERIASYPYDDAPLNEVFGGTSEQRLNLITCTGTFNRDQGTHEDRLVVYTKLVSSEKESTPPAPPTEIGIQGELLSWHAVRDEAVVGYRIYEVDSEGNEHYISSVSNNERKTFLINDRDKNYVVRTVDVFEQESEDGAFKE
ncbi:class F sortase [Bacillus sp. JCM 19041]|uniref:class F sortase n=1 Tax=Bacillus sp. JCM 19041 TaxID=1460637 RepID=UPI0006D16F4D